MQGSIRQRGRDTWQLRVYLGTDPGTRRQRWTSRTVHGSRRHAQAQLEQLKAEPTSARAAGVPVPTARSTGRGPSALASVLPALAVIRDTDDPLSATAMGRARVMVKYLIGLAGGKRLLDWKPHRKYHRKR